MTNRMNNLVAAKNEWLHQQLDVEFPTKECLSGRVVYERHLSQRQVSALDSISSPSMDLANEIFLADFHRMTIMFALLQASQFEKEAERNDVVEFLTQIIYSEPCQLYLGFENHEPVAAAIVTQCDQSILFSDLIVLPNSHFSDPDTFVQHLVHKLNIDTHATALYVEKSGE